MKLKHFFTTLIFALALHSYFAQPGSQTVIPCPTGSIGSTLPNSGFSGDNPTTATGSCGQCCYAGSDLDGDGDQDVSFSVENSRWFKWCNTSGATVTTSFTVDETANDCNLQGAIFLGGASPQGASDALDVDCGNTEFSEYGSNVNGGADGFSFGNITVANGQCAYIMVDGYAGATCTNGFSVTTTACIACTVPTTMTAGADITICEGTSGALNSTVSGGTVDGSVFYSWSPTTGLSCSNCADPVANPTSTTTYTLTACNSSSGTACCLTDQVTVNVTPNFIPNAGTDITSCAPSTVTIGGSPTGPAGSTYSWVETGANAGIAISGSATVANPSVAISAGATGSATYTVTVTNGACVRTDAVIVTVGTLAVNAGTDQDVCIGSSVVIGGTPTAPAGATYSWAETGANANVAISSATNIANPTVTVSAGAAGTATYTVTATLSGCSNTDAVTITTRPLPTTPTATASASPICAGTAVTLTAAGGAGAGTYSWWNAATGGAQLGTNGTLSVSPVTTTTYYIQSTDATYGCISARGSVTVTVNPTPVANAGSDLEVCAGTALNLAGSLTNPGACVPVQTWSVISGTGNFSNANSLTSTFTPTSTGSITLRLTPCAPGGCVPVTDDVVLTVNPSPTVDATGTSDTLCPGLATDLSAVATGGTPAPDIITTNTFSSGAGPFNIPDNNANGVVIPLTVSGVPNATLGVTDISSVEVNVSHARIGQVEAWLCPPTVATTSPYTGCLRLFDNAGGNNDNLVNTVFSDGAATDIAAGTAPYTGTFNAAGAGVLTSLDGGSTNGTWNLVVLDNSNAGSTTGTAGQWEMNFSTPTPNPNPYTYLWSTATGLSDAASSTPTLFTSSFTAPTTITKTVTVTDDNGCTGTDNVSITLLAPPTATLSGGPIDLCPGGSGIGISSTGISIDMTGVAPWTFTPVLDGSNDTPVTSSSDPYTLNIGYAAVAALGDQTMVVTVTNVSDKYCNGTSSGDFTVTAFCVLPINLISFSGEQTNRENKLSWLVSSEHKNDYYLLERSYDGISYDLLAKVDSKVNGNTTSQLEYTYTDKNLITQSMYYKLSQVDFEGEQTYLSTLQMSSENGEMKLIPNPVKNQANLQFYADQFGSRKVSLTDLQGKIIFSRDFEVNPGQNVLPMDFSKYADGMYFIQVEDKKEIIQFKVEKISN
ncbi:MAG: domain containing protein [Crocinitomicaceae bacterium]|jgi:subtilisin-like proprotein convertase family protein|nr:domain containing protein [Crocinitomicaceae bacterium]